MANISPGQIIKNLVAAEPVVIDKVQHLGAMVSVDFTGVNSRRRSNKVLDRAAFEGLEVVAQEGAFDFKGDPVRFKLFAEAERIHSAYQFDPLFAVNCSIVDPLPHQVEAVYKYLLPLPQIRFLLADDTGAGKTIMTGLLIKELMMRGFIERILIITPGGLTKQWQEDELGLKFNLPFKLVNRAAFNSDPNIFSHSDRIITSIDFLRGEDVLNVVRETRWDIVVVDEAHKLSAFDYGAKRYVSKRYEAVHALSHLTEHLLLLTATPHRGRRDTFRNLLQLLDEDIFASDSLVTERIKQMGDTGANKFFIRRLKENMMDWEGNPLFKNRETKTIQYELTTEEKDLYNRVTDYLTRKKEEARLQSNIHVSLALMVMQRRLTSSIYAIMKTLKNRYDALMGVLDAIRLNPSLWKQRHRLEDYDVEHLDDFEELEDEDREKLENVLSDPRKFKLFTTAKNPSEIREEAEQVKSLYEQAKHLYQRNQEEQKFKKLHSLLNNEGVFDRNEKLVIFTEHKDTLDYLEKRLSRSGGYGVATIHGGKSVDERRQAQAQFRKDAQILIATDAAGEGINLQFCRLLINWDIPWNPNRLEQRMGRIHRYGQQNDVLVFNMVAHNTREGKVLEKLLTKLDVIREQMGSDRVYDVISDVFEGVNLDDIVDAVLNGKHNQFNELVESSPEQWRLRFEEKIRSRRESLGHSDIDYRDARLLRDDSREKRLQPIYIKLFFEKAFRELGGDFTEMPGEVFRIEKLPEPVAQALRDDYHMATDLRDIYFCFDKDVFLDAQLSAQYGRLHYINPGNPVFDSLVKAARRRFREEMLKGAVLISPEEKDEYLAFFVKSQILDSRPTKEEESVADEQLRVVIQQNDGRFRATSPGKFIDLHAPTEFAKTFYPPLPVTETEVVQWSFNNITLTQFEDARERVALDIEKRKDYLDTAFSNVIMDLTAEINDMQGKLLLGNANVEEKMAKKQAKIVLLQERKQQRIARLEEMLALSPKAPQVLGCAFVLPLTAVEYESHYGMSRDDEVERIAMETAMQYEWDDGRLPEDVSANNEGYDIRSVSKDDLKRYIEVKGRSAEGGVMISENEYNRLSQLGDNAWLYIVINCRSTPELFRIQNPGKLLRFEVKSKGVQYFLPEKEWKAKI
jgi:superfamily II DNA or RNA helicase